MEYCGYILYDVIIFLGGVLALKVLMLDEGLHCVNVIAITFYMWFTNEILFRQFLIYSAFKYLLILIFSL